VGAVGRLAVEPIDRGCRKEVRLMMAIFGAILPRFAILAGWINDQAGWKAIFGPAERLESPELALPLGRPVDRPRDLGSRLLREPKGVLVISRDVATSAG
jgi:hypothetical protein